MGSYFSGQLQFKPITVEEFIKDSAIDSEEKALHLFNVDDLKDFDFDLENLILEGGGVKGIAYCGALKVFEELGIKFRRVAGTSAGALTAALVAVGYTADEITSILNELNLESLFLDSSIFMLIPNMLTKYGWHKSEKYCKIMKQLLEKKTGNPDITFEEVYKRYGIELCICVTNVTSHNAAFCHVKTTPNLTVWEAARMSMAIPGLIQPYKYDKRGLQYYCADGGVLVNYPLQCFDGWWLSMKPEDSYLIKISEKIPEEISIHDWQFSGRSSKSIGLVLFSGNEIEFKRKNMLKLTGYKEVRRPSSKLAKERMAKMDSSIELSERRAATYDALQNFVSSIREVQKKRGVLSGTISKSEIKGALKCPEFEKRDSCRLIFGKENVTADEAVEIVTGKIGQDEITFEEFKHYFQTQGINLQAYFEGAPGDQEFSGLTKFLYGMLDTLELNNKMEQMASGDIERTIGIFTDYLSTTDFDMSKDDKQYLIKQGIVATKKHLSNIKKKRLNSE